MHLTPAQAAQFQPALASLSDQAHVAVVAEGVPLEPRLAPKDAPDLTAGAAPGAAIAALASAYDYNVQTVGGVFVLTKRYSSPQDLPCVTLGECRAAAKTITRILDAFSPHFLESIYADGPDGQRDAIVTFFQGLTPSEIAAAQSKTLRYGALSPDQQRTINNIFLSLFMQGPEDKVTAVSDELDKADQCTITLRHESGGSALFLVPPQGPTAASLTSVLLLQSLSTSGQQDTSLTLPNASEKGLMAPSTLSTVVATLGPIIGQRATVDPPVRNKPVTACGLKYVTPADALRALVALYGLRSGVSNTEAPQIEPPYVPTPSELRQVDAAVWAALPASFDRALHLENSTLTNASASAAPGIEAQPAKPVSQAEAEAMLRAFQVKTGEARLPYELQQQAKLRLLAFLQPEIKASGQNMRVPVSSLDSGTRQALVVLMMADLVTALKDGFSGEPHELVMNCLDNMDQTVIYTVPSEMAHVNGEDVPSFYLVGTDPNTSKQVGLGGVQYFSHE